MHDDRHVQTLGRAARQEVATRRGAAHAGHDDEPRARKRRGGHGTELGRRAALGRELRQDVPDSMDVGSFVGGRVVEHQRARVVSRVVNSHPSEDTSSSCQTNRKAVP